MTTQEQNRRIFHNKNKETLVKKVSADNKFYDGFVEYYFKNSDAFSVFFTTITKKFDYKGNGTQALKDYACDLEWAKNLESCKTSSQPAQTTELWDWAKQNQSCFGQIGQLKNGESQDWILHITDEGDKWWFEKNGKFEYWLSNSTTSDINGVWSCNGGNLLIKTNDGEQFTLEKGWHKQPITWKTDCETFKKGCKSTVIKKVQDCLNSNTSSSLPQLTPDGKWGNNTQKKIEELFPKFTNGFTIDDIDTICKTSTDNSVNSTSTPTTSDPNKQPSIKPYVSTLNWEDYDTQKESIMRKKIIKEQESELNDKEFFNLVLKNNCISSDVFIPVGLKKAIDEKGNAVVAYETIKDGTDTKYYFFRNPMIVRNTVNDNVQKWSCDAIKNVKTTKTTVFEKFGIDPNMDSDELKIKVQTIHSKLQKLIDKGAISNVFPKWNNAVKSIDSTLTLTAKTPSDLTKSSGGTTTQDISELNTNWYQPSFSTQGWGDVQIWLPNGVSPDFNVVKKTTLNPKECETNLISYLTAALEWVSGKPVIPQILELQKNIKNCRRAGEYRNTTLNINDLPKLDKKLQVVKTGFLSKLFKGDELNIKEITNLLAGKNDTIKPPHPYIFNLELSESNLRGLIKTSLNEVKENKIKNNIVENIVRNRTFVLLENVKLNNKIEKIKFADRLIRESFLLETQEFDRKIIKEEFWDVMSGFFGRESSEGMFKTFKERMGDWLVTHLSPSKKDGWIPKSIKKAINQIELRDVEKITDCKFLSKKITESIIDSLNEKMLRGEKSNNGLYDIVRDGMTYDVNNPRFKEELKYKVSKMICPLIDKVSSKLDDTFDMMKQRALNG